MRLLARTLGALVFAFSLLPAAEPALVGEPARGVAAEAGQAFARYLASLGRADSWGLENVEIEASLPKLDRHGRLRAIRRSLPSGAPEYQILELAGDPTVRRQVIARYLTAEKNATALAASAVALSPANYSFRYKGAVRLDGTASYVFDLKPRRKREGLIRGELWLDGATGAPVRVSGSLVRNSSIFLRRITLSRETRLENGVPLSRLTRVFVETRLVGPAELVIHESPLASTPDSPSDSLPRLP